MPVEWTGPVHILDLAGSGGGWHACRRHDLDIGSTRVALYLRVREPVRQAYLDDLARLLGAGADASTIPTR